MTQPETHEPTAKTASRTGVLFVISRLFFGRANRHALLALFVLLAGGVAEGLSLLLLAPLLQLVQSQGEGWTFVFPADRFGLWEFSIHVGLVETLAGLCTLVSLQTVIGRSKSIVLSRLLSSVVNQIRFDLFESIGRARWQFVAGIRAADLNHLLTADIDRLQNAVFGFLMLLQGVILIVVYACVSWVISPAMTIFAASSGLTILLLMQPARKLASAYGRELTDQRQGQYRIITEFLSGMKVSKSFNAERRYSEQLGSALGRSQDDLIRFVRASSTGTTLLQIANVLALSVFIYTAVVWFSLPMDRLVVLILLYMRISPRFTALQSTFQEILVNASALQTIQKLQGECDRNREEEAVTGVPLAFAREISFQNVSFDYAGSDVSGVIRDASFTIPANSVTALVGASGAGKSTIADLLMGLLAPEAGQILVDGVPLTDGNRRIWRDSVGYVPQDTVLLNDTIEANMRLAAPSASVEAIWHALRTANAEKFVRSLPEGLQTNVGDRGGRLSGGERQRIALARAVLRRPRLLILDEATNALDWENRNAIDRSIAALRQEMAVVVIAHHPSMTGFADFAVAVENGSIVETGAADALRRNPASRLNRFANSGSAL